MTKERAKRKLTAILSADVKGYSRLMGEDELSTVETLKRYREIISSLVQHYRGRVVDSPGDNILSEFSSVVDAVECAVKIQGDLQEKNANLPENRRMEFRIGVNLGDVIDDEGRIYGDGVNVAARVEGLAEVGGICISGTAFDHVKNKLKLGYEYLGEQPVKNITEPVRAYKVLLEPKDAGKLIGVEPKASPKRWIWPLASAVAVVLGIFAWQFYEKVTTPDREPASVKNMSFPLPEKPSIAVLPFDNMSGDTEQDYIANGFTKNIITGLSQIPEMFVIARNSVFTYKEKSVKIKQVSEELGVKYVLEGSIQKEGDRLRVNAQLIDALEGHHLWAERYDRELKDLFKVQDEITLKILSTLHVKLVTGGDGIIWGQTDSFEAWGHHVKGWHYFDKSTKQDNLKAREHHEQALKLDPDYGAAWEQLAWTFIKDVWLGSSDSPGESIKQALAIAEKTSNHWSKGGLPFLMSEIYLLQRQFEKAITEGKKAVALDPNNSRCHIGLAGAFNRGAKPEEAIFHAKQAMRLEPFYPAWYLDWVLGAAYDQAGHYEDALEVYKKLLDRALKGEYPVAKAHRRIAVIYAKLDRMEEALAHGAESLKIDSDFFVERWRKKARFLYKNQKYINSSAEMLLKAGLPETPPLPLPDKPSIAVLPFVNMSGDPEQEYFSDGMTDDLITDLSKISRLFIIARNTTFQYKGKTVDVKKIGRELGVKYILEGSVRRAENKVRINAQLVDATTGGHIWAERYDGMIKDVFSLQDKVTKKIVGALAVKLTTGEQKALASRGTDNIEAYDAFTKGWQHYLRFTAKDVALAINFIERAIELDPKYSKAYAALSLIYWSPGGSGKEWHKALKADYFSSRVIARNYLNMAMQKPTSLAYRVASGMDLMRRRHDNALQKAEKAIALIPNDSESLLAMARALVYSGRPKEAIDTAKKVMRLDPLRTGNSLYLMGIAYFSLSEYEKAIVSFQRTLKYKPTAWAEQWLATIYSHLGRDKDAKIALTKYRKKWIDDIVGETVKITELDLQPAVYMNPFRDPEITERFVEGLIKAGHPKPHRYYEVHEENKLTGDEIRDLVSGRTQILSGFSGGSWTQKFDKEGGATYEGFGMRDTGTWWIDGDQMCGKYQKMLQGLPLCNDYYHNPTGTLKNKDDYLQVNDFGIFPLTYVDLL